jgi:hypothetical protein
MNLPQALEFSALIICFIFTAPLKGWWGNVVFHCLTELLTLASGCGGLRGF